MITACGVAGARKEATLTYPAAPTDATTDVYFGHTVADPYRPLEDDTAAATTAWVEAENAVTRAYLDAIPFRNALRERIATFNDYAKTTAPSKWNDGKYYWSYNDGLKNQAVIYRASTPYGTDAEVFLDPNSLSDDGTVALTGLYQSKDGTYTAYTISRSGSDWTEIYVMDSKSRKLLSDHIEWAKFTGAAWLGDGFLYSAYPRPEAGKEFSNANEYHSVYYHKLGTPQSADTVVFENRNEPLRFHSVDTNHAENLIIISGGGQGNGNSLTIRELNAAKPEWTVIEPGQDYTMEVVDYKDGKLYVYTSVDAPMNRLVVIDTANPARAAWKEVIPETDAVLTSVKKVGKDHFMAVYDRDASHHAILYMRDGTPVREVSFPTYGSVNFNTDGDCNEVFYTFNSFTFPSAVYSYDINTGNSSLLKAPEIKDFNMDDYVTEQVFFTSADGTRVPMFLTYRKGLKRNGNNPVYLYGYGGFNISLNPAFNANRLVWLENGGVYAQVNLRGGAEYGDRWHVAGTLMQKQNVFDDFIGAAEYLIKEKWTRPDLLAIEGGSNGGLLVGAVTNQRPELFRVAIPRVGVMDMMRYHLFTIGWNWAHDYGTSADSEDMALYLLGYSPLHNISNNGRPYPAIMVTTADHDDRVVPAHSFKYAATLQAADTGNRPKLIRIDSKAGHGAGKPIAKVIDEYADIYAFIFKNMGITPKCSR